MITPPGRTHRGLNFIKIPLGITAALAFAIFLALFPLVVVDLAPNSPEAIRAQQTIEHISQSPRFGGDPNHTSTRNFLLHELRLAGLEVDLQVARVDEGPVPLENVVGRLVGKNPAHPAVLLVAHYDSFDGSPGAADNASGVAVVLEIVRAAAAQRPHANDLIVLFSDGEELGMLGAAEFARSHPGMKDIRVVLNLDTFSVGPAFIWQSSPRNGWLINQIAAYTPNPMGASWVDSIARALPLGTDLEPFLAAGLTGASLTTPYLPIQAHSGLDQPGFVTIASLHHTIQQALPLTLGLLQQDLTQPEAPDQIYYSLWSRLMVRYPASLAAAIGLLVGVLYLASAVWNVRLQTLPIRPVLAAVFFTLLAGLLAGLVQILIELLILLNVPLLPVGVKIVLSVLVIGLLFTFLYTRMQKHSPARAVLLGAQAVWAALVLWTSLQAPFFSPLPTFILVTSLLFFATELLPTRWQWACQGLRLCAAFLVLFLSTPVVYLLMMSSGTMMLPAVLGSVILALSGALLAPLIDLLNPQPQQQEAR